MDDIEIALNKKYQIDLQLTSNQELENNDDYFKKYYIKKAAMWLLFLCL